MDHHDSSHEPLGCQRAEFTLPDEVHYFDCAFMAPLLLRVESAAIGALIRNRVPRFGPRDFFSEADLARQLFAKLINCPDPQRIALVPSVSYGLATAARNLQLQAGQNIVVAGGQFPSNVYVWRRLAERTGCVVRTVRAPESLANRAQAWSNCLVDAIDGATGVVALGTIDWSDGTPFELEAIGERARTVGAAFVLDAIQSVGAAPFDLQRVQPDALVCGAYKWLLGPMGIGLAYLGPRFEGGEPLEETWLGRVGSRDFTQLDRLSEDCEPGAIRYDMGGRAQFILLPMLNAALQQLLLWQPRRIQEYCTRLVVPLVTAARDLGFETMTELDRSSHLFALRPPTRTDAARLQAGLAERNVFTSLRAGSLRISPHVYNDERDVVRLIEGLRDLTTSNRPQRLQGKATAARRGR